MDSNQRAHSNIKNFCKNNDKTNNYLKRNAGEKEKEIDLFKFKDEFFTGKKYLAIKLPGRIENNDKAIELLGGKELINKKVNKIKKFVLALLYILYFIC